MGNGHAPGTAIGLGAAGVETATGFGAERPGEAGLAVFFFAAFFTAGFLAGFFLATALRAGALRTADFRAAGLRLADLRLATTRFDLDAVFFLLALRAMVSPTTFFFADFCFADFFLTAIRPSVL